MATKAELLTANDALFTTNGTNDIEGIEVNGFIEELINSVWAEFGDASFVKLNLKGYANFADTTVRTILKGDTFINSAIGDDVPVGTYEGDWIVCLDSGAAFSEITAGTTNSVWFYFPFGRYATIPLIRAGLEALTTTNRLNKSAIQGGEYALNKRGTGDVYGASYKGGSMQNRLKGDFWIVSGPTSPADGDTSALLAGDWVIAVKDDADYSNYSDTAEWLLMKFTKDSNTQTLTNKRITPRITTITSHATPTINTDICDCVTITAQAEAITSMTTNLSGTPTNFQKLTIRIKTDSETTRNITWGASFENKGVALPASAKYGLPLTVELEYDTVSSKWGCVKSIQTT